MTVPTAMKSWSSTPSPDSGRRWPRWWRRELITLCPQYSLNPDFATSTLVPSSPVQSSCSSQAWWQSGSFEGRSAFDSSRMEPKKCFLIALVLRLVQCVLNNYQYWLTISVYKSTKYIFKYKLFCYYIYTLWTWIFLHLSLICVLVSKKWNLSTVLI